MAIHDDGIGPTGRFPNGKLNSDDGGELQIAIGRDVENNVIMIQFGIPVRWVGLDKKAAHAFAALLVTKAEALA